LQTWIQQMAAYRTQLSKILILPRFTLILIPGLYHSIFLNKFSCTMSLMHLFYRLPKPSMEEKVKYLSVRVDSHLNDSENAQFLYRIYLI